MQDTRWIEPGWRLRNWTATDYALDALYRELRRVKRECAERIEQRKAEADNFMTHTWTYNESRKPCPRCGVKRWWAEFRTANMEFVVYMGLGGVVAFRYCRNCGHRKVEGMAPPSFIKGLVFPVSDDEELFLPDPVDPKPS